MMTKTVLVGFILLLTPFFCHSQHRSPAIIFAHNDYQKPRPFFDAYSAQVGYIEVDVHLVDGELFVAHDLSEIDSARTLSSLYLERMQNLLQVRDTAQRQTQASILTLMIDMKTEGQKTLAAICEVLKRYPEIISSKSVRIAVSGEMPDPADWDAFPSFIYFDGRPGVHYSPAQLKRVVMISAAFGDYSHWNGVGPLSQPDKDALVKAIANAHRLKKAVRFWGSPDNKTAWQVWLSLGIDIINTDLVVDVAAFLGQQ